MSFADQGGATVQVPEPRVLDLWSSRKGPSPSRRKTKVLPSVVGREVFEENTDVDADRVNIPSDFPLELSVTLCRSSGKWSKQEFGQNKRVECCSIQTKKKRETWCAPPNAW